jgi:hypothetical protein
MVSTTHSFVSLTVLPTDLNRLPPSDSAPLLFICNRWAKGWDEKTLTQLLAPQYPTLKILLVAERPSFLGKWKAMFFEKNMASVSKILKKSVEKHAKQTVLALPISFSDVQLQDPFYQKNLNNFFKTVRDTGFFSKNTILTTTLPNI